MKNLDKSIPLRPRFRRESSKTPEELLERVKFLKSELKNDYEFTISDKHLWIYLHKQRRKFYSPHLHLEFEPHENGGTLIRALFGPDPTLWTLFMFLHFVVAGIFLFFCVTAYSHYILKESYYLDLMIMGIMVIIWFILYFFGRFNRSKGTPQMYELLAVLDRICFG
ncbi:conserved hypothetical protein [Capnocytophaga canimorsus]|uniref:Uncharacterized protein n=1 Tax=Capnocytophaga canimorsus TaxID=28188 RepID=A0A0B7H105_9FLAO|nr:hypothetical protein [Capnocytophaga canimorsus]ATA76381.1 hypothetical protein CGC47_01590 [Capnocytophaga canimorsus]PJI79596.1 hypothetical protein CLV61_1482 [Capnocytophaga canimorsus]CEN33211.1 conserved hypothetical protein [Capnocytophaga canimorsus]STA71521.1 Uncharacterised protein [Capnocytophaga canimorsus]